MLHDNPVQHPSFPPVAVLDGGLGSHLEAIGHDLSGDLWSARLLHDHPDAIRDAHHDYFASGADIAISASYQLSFDGARRRGLSDDDATELMRASVALATEARDEHRPEGLVAASVGPYGAARADGSEYRGDYDLDRAGLRAWHARRLTVLAESGADLLAIETIPSRTESRALLELLRGTGVAAWLSFTVADGRLRTGESLTDAFADADAVDEIVAVGINCSHPAEVSGAIRAARSVTDKPIVVYPNSGEHWNRAQRRWEGEPGFAPAQVSRWLEQGASIVGGCCRVGPAEIAGIADVVRRHAPAT